MSKTNSQEMRKKERRLHCCFIFELVLIYMNPETCNSRIREPPTTTVSPVKGEHFEWHTDKSTNICMSPKGKPPRFPHGWLKTYPHYDCVDRRW